MHKDPKALQQHLHDLQKQSEEILPRRTGGQLEFSPHNDIRKAHRLPGETGDHPVVLQHGAGVQQAAKGRDRRYQGEALERASRRRLRGVSTVLLCVFGEILRCPRSRRLLLQRGIRRFQAEGVGDGCKTGSHPMSGVRRLYQLGEHFQSKLYVSCHVLR